MDKNLYNLSSIESFFDGLFANKLSENTFFGDLPRAISERELIKIVEESNDEHYRIRNGGSYVTYDSKRNLHINTRIIELVIV